MYDFFDTMQWYGLLPAAVNNNNIGDSSNE
jgi:hypothetical protein